MAKRNRVRLITKPKAQLSPNKWKNRGKLKAADKGYREFQRRKAAQRIEDV